jgi:hypothetical protein
MYCSRAETKKRITGFFVVFLGKLKIVPVWLHGVITLPKSLNGNLGQH